MAPTEKPDFADLARRLEEARLRELVDLYVARTADVWWRIEDHRVVARRELLREGAAARFASVFVSSDGLDRLVLAELLGLPARTVPAFTLAPFPRPPEIDTALAAHADGPAELHWRGAWACLIGAGRVLELTRPELLEVALPDGRRLLYTWPLPRRWRPPEPVPPAAAEVRSGRQTALLAPAAAAVLFHELLAHPLEGDLLRRGASPLTGAIGSAPFSIPLDVDDDPTVHDLPGSFALDDEGVEARRRPLVRRGRLVGMLCDRASAEALGGAPGNARRAGVHSPPRPRASNLVVRARGGDVEATRGEATVEITGLSSGSVEPHTGLVILTVRHAWELRRGRRIRPLAPFVIGGTIAEVLSGVRAVAGGAEASAEPGWCSKDGEVVPTGAVAPWVLVGGMEVR